MLPATYPQWRRPGAHPPAVPATEQHGDAVPLLLPPEQWFRSRYPSAYVDPEERVFAEKDGVLIGFASEYMIARCLGPVGSPDRPLVYCPEEEEFYRYNPEEGIYRRIPREAVRHCVVDLLEACVAGSFPAYRAQVLGLRNSRVIRGVAEALKTVAAVPVAAFTPDYSHLPVQNGLLNLRTLQLSEYAPVHMVRAKLPIPWVVDAAAPERFDAYIDGMFPDPADRRLAIAIAAMAVLGNPAQRIAIITGAAGGGKTTYSKLIGKLMSQGEVGELRLQHASDRFESSGWIGKRLLNINDAKADELVRGAEYLKRISGQDPMEAEFKNSRTKVSFIPRALPLITANPDLRVKLEQDRAAWERRLVVLHVERAPRAADISDFETHLMMHEGAGIIRCLAEAAREILLHGVPPLTAEQQRRVQALLDASDPVGDFVARYTVSVKRANITSAEALEAVQRFIRRESQPPVSSRQLEQQLVAAMRTAHGVEPSHSIRRDGKQRRGWRGVRLLDDE
jgi:putative DNA primase/helicase